MGIIRVKKDKGFFAASNIPFNDGKLSWEARGVLGYLLSKPDDWQVRFYDLMKQGPAGEYKLRRILKELEENDYLVRHRVQDREGKFDWVSTIYETPTISRLSIDGLPTDGVPIDGSPTGGKPRDIVSTDPKSTDGNNKGINKHQVDALGGVGIYILDLVDLDYNDADKKIRAGINQLIDKYGERRLSDLARLVVEDYPKIKLGALFKRIDEYSLFHDYDHPKEGELGY